MTFEQVLEWSDQGKAFQMEAITNAEAFRWEHAYNVPRARRPVQLSWDRGRRVDEIWVCAFHVASLDCSKDFRFYSGWDWKPLKSFKTLSICLFPPHLITWFNFSSLYMYSSVSFIICIDLCNHHSQDIELELFITTKKFLCVTPL